MDMEKRTQELRDHQGETLRASKGSDRIYGYGGNDEIYAGADIHQIANNTHCLSESSLEMVRTASGKPVFKNAPGIQFSISHSGGYVACALSGLPIGIDIEDASRDFTGITGHILSEDEFSCYSKLDHAGRNRFICVIWTLKEALGKYRGCGLAYDLKTVSFEICDDEAILSGSGETLHFETLSIGDSHLLSVCSEEPGPVSCRFDSPKELVAAGKRRSLW